MSRLNSTREQSQAPQAILACGALAKEINLLRAERGWPVDLYALPAILHNTPAKIVTAVAERLGKLCQRYQQVIIGYGDCGTGGALDRLLESHPRARRIPGPHCYEIFSGQRFWQQMEREPGTYFLTDYLAHNFQKLVVAGNGLDRDPAMRDFLFANYQRLVWIAQSDAPEIAQQAAAAAKTLQLPLTIWHTGLDELTRRIEVLLSFPVKANNISIGSSHVKV